MSELRLFRRPGLLLVVTIATYLVFQVSLFDDSEPFFNNDETRHVMTGVFFHDLFCDLPMQDLEEYTVRYYAQYPALGLLVWPPFFYVVEAISMLVIGPSMLAAKTTIWLFGIVAVAYLFALVKKTHGVREATLATQLFIFSPMIVLYSHHVMLEIPCIACCLAAIYHLLRYLDDFRRRDLWLGTVAVCLAGLTRHDAVFLLPCLAILLLLRRQLSVLFRREVVAAFAVTVAVLLPYYALVAVLIGDVQFSTAVSGNSTLPSLSIWEQSWYYPASLPRQISWFVLLPALVGIAYVIWTREIRRSAVYFAMMVATFLTFAPLGERDSRHASVWIPAFVAFAAIAISRVPLLKKHTGLQFGAGAMVVLGTFYISSSTSTGYVNGYRAAAEFVLANSSSPTCLIDSTLDGNFTFQMRSHDPDRKMWVLRGDKLFYSTVSTYRDNYTEWIQGKQELLDMISEYDPEFILVETPRILGVMPMGRLLRETLRDTPTRFRLERTFPVASNQNQIQNVQLLVYRNLVRSHAPGEKLAIRMLWPDKTIVVDMPASARPPVSEPSIPGTAAHAKPAGN